VTATAGSDYDAASGTITFRRGETSKSIDVVVHGDTIPENNENVLLALRNPLGATLAKSSGFAVIEDDDQIADLALSLDFSTIHLPQFLRNADERHKTTARAQRRISRFVTTAHQLSMLQMPARTCPVMPALAPGRHRPGARLSRHQLSTVGHRDATQLQRDPQTANNSVGWTQSDFMAMGCSLPHSGSAMGTSGFSGSSNAQSISIESSDPAVISVPSTLDAPRK